MTKHNWNNDEKRELVGWLLFLVCGVFFLISSIRYKDFYSLAGTIIFMIACLIFMVSYFRKP
jgi:cell division protein FtsW (lipid II flippase)